MGKYRSSNQKNSPAKGTYRFEKIELGSNEERKHLHLYDKIDMQWTPVSQIYRSNQKIIFGQNWFLNKKNQKCMNYA